MKNAADTLMSWMINMKEKIEFVTLECGHSVNPNVALGVCTKCSKKSCAKCLQLIDGMLLCPSCFVKFTNNKDGCCD